MIGKFAGSVLALALAATLAGAAALTLNSGAGPHGDAPYLAAGLPLAARSGYAPGRATVSYPPGFTSAGVTITGPDLTGIGSAHGMAERLISDGSMATT
jgi:hypothetical protein